MLQSASHCVNPRASIQNFTPPFHPLPHPHLTPPHPNTPHQTSSLPCPAPCYFPVEPKAEWYHAAFHTVTAMVGAGVLALPYSFSYLTWGGGLVCLGACTALSLYCSHLLADFHELPDGTRLNRYRDLGRSVLGNPPPSPWVFGNDVCCCIRVLQSIQICLYRPLPVLPPPLGRLSLAAGHGTPLKGTRNVGLS